MAAAGSAVGLGNIWGFPTQVASNGGAAFLLVYLIMAFCLAYPVLMAELIIGRHAKANTVTALQKISTNGVTRNLGTAVGFAGMLTVCLILSFYAIVAGWMVAFSLSPVLELAQMNEAASWVTGFGIERNLVFTVIFMLLTTAVNSAGVSNGIEKWSSRLMPVLLVILLLLIVYVLTLDGSMEGLRAYLVPDFSRVLDANLIVRAMGQAFFSMSLGVGTMLIYGSYVSNRENLVSLGRAVTFIDIGIAVMAGLLIIPAMYVAQNNGVQILDSAGNLIAEDTLIFTVLPALFDTMGGVGMFAATAFFILMSIAALTSSISMLEVPVAYLVENHGLGRKSATLILGATITLISVITIFNFGTLFGLIITATTRFSQPLGGLMLCVFAGWIWRRNSILAELKEGYATVEHGWFWKIWPTYVRFVCPLAILTVFANGIWS